MRSLNLRQKQVLTAILVLGVATRIASAFYQGNHVSALPGVADQISYHTLAVRVLEGHGFTFGSGWWPATPAGQPTAHWSYLYVLFLAGVYAVFGTNPLAARIVQAVAAGILQPLLTWRIGARLFGPTTGLTAAALSCSYAYFVFYGGALMTEPLYVVALLWVVDFSTLLMRPNNGERNPQGFRTWVELGLALACASLLRQITLLLAPAILAFVTYRAAKIGRKAGHVLPIVARACVAGAVVVVCIIPWTIRNYMAFGQVVLLNTNAGFAFFWGNHPIHGTHFIPLLPAAGPSYGALIPNELRTLNEAAMDRALLRRGLDFVRKDPARYARLSASRFAEYLKFWPEEASSAASNYARTLSFGVCLPFFISGVLLAVFHHAAGGYPRDPFGIALPIAVATVYSAFYLLTWTLVRYRLPVDALLMPFAGWSMVSLRVRVAGAARNLRVLVRRFAT
jgi:hypothetical protein